MVTFYRSDRNLLFEMFYIEIGCLTNVANTVVLIGVHGRLAAPFFFCTSCLGEKKEKVLEIVYQKIFGL